MLLFFSAVSVSMVKAASTANPLILLIPVLLIFAVPMKQNKLIILAFILLIVCGALYRLIPGRPLGFAPQLAMAIFGGAVIKDKKWAFAVPMFSMLLSDAIFEVLTRAGVVNMPGFYAGQWFNYILIAGVCFMGMGIKKLNAINIGTAALGAPVAFYLLSNFGVWMGNGGYAHPKTWDGLVACMADGLPFFRGSLIATVAFSAVFFGLYFLTARTASNAAQRQVI